MKDFDVNFNLGACVSVSQTLSTLSFVYLCMQYQTYTALRKA